MECLKPRGISNPKTGLSMRVRCGKCLPCRQFKAGQWTVRLQEQMKDSVGNWFITLTLNDENLTYGIDPISPTLSKRDLQLFFKLLRRHYPDLKFKYYAVGEYGSNTKRPHYHMILFDTKIKDKNELNWMLLGSWNKGFHHIGDVTQFSIRYVAGYLEKGIYGETPSYEIQREFSLMSKGLGINYVNRTKKYHNENEKFEYHTGGGDFISLPRYYREKIFSDEERQKYAETVADQYASRPSGLQNERNSLRARIERLRSKNNLKKERK